MELKSSVHVSGLLQALFPLAILFQKAMGKAGSFIGWVQLIPKPPNILPKLGTCDSGQEQPDVKVLASRRVDKVHLANDVTLTMWLPLLELLLLNKALRKVMICDIICTLQSGIGNKPLCEGSLFDCITIHKRLKVIIIKIDGLLIFKMNRQMIDGRFFLIHGKFHNMLDNLDRTNIITTYVIKYLINVFSNSKGGLIMAFVYVDVLDGLDRGTDFRNFTDFNIYVTVVPCR